MSDAAPPDLDLAQPREGRVMDGGNHPGDVAPSGWYLGRESWSFHRQFYERTGRPAEWHEYTDILWQIRLGERERRVAPKIYRVKLTDGKEILARGGRRTLYGVLPLDWVPPPEPEVVPAANKVAAKQAAQPTPAAQPRPVKATTLTLGAKGDKNAAVKVLESRLKRIGIPAREVIGAPSR